jgi:ferredoxin
MKFDSEKCCGCGSCQPYCPVNAIYYKSNGKAAVEYDTCVECGVCCLPNICTSRAILSEKHSWPRSVRAAFSNPGTVHTITKIAGRGTEEIKTNDVTNRYPLGMVGVAIELGRPSVGTRFRDVEKVSKLIADLGGEFMRDNPMTSLIKDMSTGELDPSILDEKVLSVILECLIPIEDLQQMLEALMKLSPQLETVFSLNICSRYTIAGETPYEGILTNLNLSTAPNGKLNLGLANLQHGENK